MNKRILLYLLAGAVVLTGVLSYILPSYFALFSGTAFAIFLPGISVWLLLQRPLKRNWYTAVNIVGLGILFAMCIGLFSNWLLYSLHVTRPLDAIPLLLSIGTATLAVLFVGYHRWPQRLEFPETSKFTTLEWGAISSATLLLLVLAAGALRLNNGASGSVAIIGYVLSFSLLISTLVLAGKLRQNVIIYTVWAVGLGIFLSGSLRSAYVAGPDISAEYQVLNLVQQSGHWSMSLYRNAYNACLSVSLLPVILAAITKLSGAVIIKLVIPFLYSFLIPITFLITRRYFNKKGALLAAFFFITQPAFYSWWWIPIRQETAFLFFGLLALTMVCGIKKNRTQLGIFMLFGLGMIVSHYSTSYLTLALLTLLVAIHWVYRKFQKDAVARPAFLPRSTTIVLLALMLFAWYSQMTYGFNNFEQFLTRSFINIGGILNEDNQAQGQTIFDQLNPFSHAGTTGVDVIGYEKASVDTAQSRFDSKELYAANADEGIQSASLPSDGAMASHIVMGRSLIIVIGKVVVGAGVLLLLYKSWRSRQFEDYSFLSTAGLLLIFIIIVTPFLSLAYDQVRTFQQLVVFMGGTVAVVATYLDKRRLTRVVTVAFIAIYFLFVSGLPLAFTRAQSVPMAFKNYGDQYSYYFVHPSDYVAAQWMARNPKSLIAGDTMSKYKLRLAVKPPVSEGMIQGVFPSAIPQTAYVFVDSTNSRTGAAIDSFRGGTITYGFPTSFLQDRKNQVYSNGADSFYR